MEENPGKKTLDIYQMWQVTIVSVLRKSDSLACIFYNGLVAIQGIRITIINVENFQNFFEKAILLCEYSLCEEGNH
jgi:riboflavin synthase alpha subunit